MTDLPQLFSLHGRTAIVTGASSGLGARFVETLSAAGATVYAAARRLDRLQELAERLERVHPVACDVSSAADRERLVATAGVVHVLVNNAGVSGGVDALAEDADAFRHVLDVNVAAPFQLAALVARAASTDAPTSVINVGSILGLVAGHPVGGAGYAASKAGIVGLTRELAAQWASRGVRVNTLAPGWFPTEMNQELFADQRSRGWIHKNTMLRRHGEAHELDGALLFLASAASSYVTGQVLVVDGGWTAR